MPQPRTIQDSGRDGVLDLIFNHTEASDWYWGDAAIEIEKRLPPDDPASFDAIEAALQSLPELAARYSAWQVATGFEYLFNNVLSSYVFLFEDPRIDETRRVHAAGNLLALFDPFFRHAATWTGPAHQQRTTDGGPQARLNIVCYMFWDTCPLPGFGIPAITSACIDVMERCLSMPNNAVIESALHGLGHLAPGNRRAAELAASFAARGRGHPNLIAYARAASAGHVQ